MIPPILVSGNMDTSVVVGSVLAAAADSFAASACANAAAIFSSCSLHHPSLAFVWRLLKCVVTSN